MAGILRGGRTRSGAPSPSAHTPSSSTLPQSPSSSNSTPTTRCAPRFSSHTPSIHADFAQNSIRNPCSLTLPDSLPGVKVVFVHTLNTVGFEADFGQNPGRNPTCSHRRQRPSIFPVQTVSIAKEQRSSGYDVHQENRWKLPASHFQHPQTSCDPPLLTPSSIRGPFAERVCQFRVTAVTVSRNGLWCVTVFWCAGRSAGRCSGRYLGGRSALWKLPI